MTTSLHARADSASSVIPGPSTTDPRSRSRSDLTLIRVCRSVLNSRPRPITNHYCSASVKSFSAPRTGTPGDHRYTLCAESFSGITGHHPDRGREESPPTQQAAGERRPGPSTPAHPVLSAPTWSQSSRSRPGPGRRDGFKALSPPDSLDRSTSSSSGTAMIMRHLPRRDVSDPMVRRLVDRATFGDGHWFDLAHRRGNDLRTPCKQPRWMRPAVSFPLLTWLANEDAPGRSPHYSGRPDGARCGTTPRGAGRRTPPCPSPLGDVCGPSSHPLGSDNPGVDSDRTRSNGWMDYGRGDSYGTSDLEIEPIRQPLDGTAAGVVDHESVVVGVSVRGEEACCTESFADQ